MSEEGAGAPGPGGALARPRSGVPTAAGAPDVATRLLGASTQEEVLTVVLRQGLGALGCSDGAVVLRDGDSLRVVPAPGGRRAPGQVPVTSGLPEAEAAAGATVELRAVPGRGLVTAVPLLVRGAVAGSLVAQWDPADAPGHDGVDRVTALSSLASQALARVASDRERDLALARAERMGERFAVLSEVGDLLASGVAEDEALRRLARIVVPALADWCVVTLVSEEGRWHDAGSAHVDPSREAEVAVYAAQQNAAMSPGSPVATALRTGRPVVVERLTEEALTAALPDPEVAQVARRLAPCGVAAMPMTTRGRTVGVLALVTTTSRGPHTSAELGTALEVARRAGTALENASLFGAQKRLVEGLQRSMLTPPAELPGVDVAVRYLPASRRAEVGGDWYDVFVQPSGSPVLVIGDVMGHDVEAAAGMGQLRSLLRGIAYTTDEPPDEVLRRTDEAMAGLGLRTTATALVGRLDDVGRGRRRLVWSNAGHPPPVVLRADGTAGVADEAHGMLLGVLPSEQRSPTAVVLEPGDTLLLCTDGLVERRDQPFDVGQDRLLAALADLPAAVRASPEAVCDAVLESMAPGERTDDVALVAVRVDDLPA